MNPLFPFSCLLAWAVSVCGGETLYLASAGPEPGIYRSRVDDAAGELSPPERLAVLEKPAYLAFSPDQRHLYAVHAVEKESVVSAYTRQADGTLTFLNRQPTGGSGGCHLSVDATGRTLLVAHYGSGSVAALPIAPDGSVQPAVAPPLALSGTGPHPRRQTRPHPHSLAADPENRLAYCGDLGTDRIRIFRLHAGDAVLEEIGSGTVPPGGGPRHLALGPGVLYACNEMGVSVTTFARAGDGTLTPLDTQPTVPPGTPLEGVTTAGIRLHPSGSPLYVSNRGTGTLAVFPVGADGRLGKRGETATGTVSPWDLALSPSGKWLAVAGRADDRLTLLPLDPATGHPGAPVAHAAVGKPGCVLFAIDLPPASAPK